MKKTKISRGVLLALLASSAVSVMSSSQAAENTEPPPATGIGIIFQDYNVTSGKWAKIATPDNTIANAFIVSGPGANDRVFLDEDVGNRGVKILVNEISDGVETKELVVRIVTSEGFEEDVRIAVIPKPIPVLNAVPTAVECGITNAEKLDLGSFTYKYELSTQDMIEVLHFAENAVYPSFIESIIPTLSRVKVEDFSGSFTSAPLNTGYTFRPVPLMYAGDPGSPTSRYGSIHDNYNWDDVWDFNFGSFEGPGSITFDSYSVGSATGTFYYEGGENDSLTFSCPPPEKSEPPITLEERKKELIEILNITEMYEVDKFRIKGIIDNASELSQLVDVEAEIKQEHKEYKDNMIDWERRKSELREKLKKVSPQIRQSEVKDFSERIDVAKQGHGKPLEKIEQDIERAVQRSEGLLNSSRKSFVEDLELEPSYPEDDAAIRKMINNMINPYTYDYDLVRDAIKTAHKRWSDDHPHVDIDALRNETFDLINKLQMDERTREKLISLLENSWTEEGLNQLQREARQAHEEFEDRKKLNERKDGLRQLIDRTEMSVEDRELLLNVINNAEALSELTNMEKRIEDARIKPTSDPDPDLAKEKARLRALLTKLPVSDADYDRLSARIKNAKVLSELDNVEKDIRDSNRRFTSERDLFNRKLELQNFLLSVKNIFKDDRAAIRNSINAAEKMSDLNGISDRINQAVNRYNQEKLTEDERQRIIDLQSSLLAEIQAADIDLVDRRKLERILNTVTDKVQAEEFRESIRKAVQAKKDRLEEEQSKPELTVAKIEARDFVNSSGLPQPEKDFYLSLINKANTVPKVKSVQRRAEEAINSTTATAEDSSNKGGGGSGGGSWSFGLLGLLALRKLRK